MKHFLVFTLPAFAILSLLIHGCYPLPEEPTQPHQSYDSSAYSGSFICIGTSPAVSPDGNKLAFLNDRKIFVSDSNGTNIVQLTPNNVLAEAPQWSPDGKYIGFVQYDSVHRYNSHLLRINVATKAMSTIISADPLSPSGSIGDLWSWSPDNHNVAVASSLNGAPLCKIIKNDGSGQTIGQYPLEDFSWNSDGTKLVGLKRVNYDTSSIFVATIGSDSLIKIDSQPYDPRPKWQPHKNVISYRIRSGHLIFYDLESNNEVRQERVEEEYQFSPDGNNIAYLIIWRDGNPDADLRFYINNLNLLTNEDKNLVISNRTLSFTWAPSSKEIYYGFDGKIYKLRMGAR